MCGARSSPLPPKNRLAGHDFSEVIHGVTDEAEQLMHRKSSLGAYRSRVTAARTGAVAAF